MISLLAKDLTDKIYASTQKRIVQFKQLNERVPKLVVLVVGDDPASAIYVKKKAETAQKLGMLSQTIQLPLSASSKEVFEQIQRLNEDPTVDGILVQRPLLKSFIEEEVMYWVLPEKDVDAFHPTNVGRLVLGQRCLQPCTPAGIMELLKHYGIAIAGKTACIVGRSSIVGKPMAALLLQADATVIQCHSKTPDIMGFTQKADIIIAAAGKRHLIGANHVNKGAVVIDVGIHRDGDGKITGDVDFAGVSLKASAITPVPGGVGPMTIAMLMQNTVLAAELRS